jgi:hypothetical protein
MDISYLVYIINLFFIIMQCFFPRYTALVEQNFLQATKDMEKVLEVSIEEIQEENPPPPSPLPYPLLSKKFFRRHGLDLFGCSSTWFLLDIVFYSNNLFQSRILTRADPHGGLGDHGHPKIVLNLYKFAILYIIILGGSLQKLLYKPHNKIFLLKFSPKG